MTCNLQQVHQGEVSAAQKGLGHRKPPPRDSPDGRKCWLGCEKVIHFFGNNMIVQIKYGSQQLIPWFFSFYHFFCTQIRLSQLAFSETLRFDNNNDN